MMTAPRWTRLQPSAMMAIPAERHDEHFMHSQPTQPSAPVTCDASMYKRLPPRNSAGASPEWRVRVQTPLVLRPSCVSGDTARYLARQRAQVCRLGMVYGYMILRHA